jgi:hypothetical protein
MRTGTNMTARSKRHVDTWVKGHMQQASITVSLTWARTSQQSPSAPTREARRSSSDSNWDDVDEVSDEFSESSDDESDDPSTLGYVQAASRDVITKNLYPRLLYAFSDVVCFVTSNTRSVNLFFFFVLIQRAL